ncbi:MAG: hypothetical protein J6P94_06100, partial [Oscillospiraceae bacterium]|nr:hypothetical protein [Oscillospiraceae bacterium]
SFFAITLNGSYYVSFAQKLLRHIAKAFINTAQSFRCGYPPPPPKIRCKVFSPLAVGFWLLAVGYWPLAVGCWPFAFGCWLLAIGSWLLAFGRWLLALGFWLLALGC